jgi:hypothetical protein
MVSKTCPNCSGKIKTVYIKTLDYNFVVCDDCGWGMREADANNFECKDLLLIEKCKNIKFKDELKFWLPKNKLTQRRKDAKVKKGLL